MPILKKKGYDAVSYFSILIIIPISVRYIEHLHIFEPIQAPIIMVATSGAIWFGFKNALISYLTK